ncbi:hypothetical protein [Microcoleus sp. herbarium12]|uniref:hypothetical protein n=1 Tax=Microcoleus sp. herbarium12 TaxID=3055437 RepID=UPI002FD41760
MRNSKKTTAEPWFFVRGQYFLENINEPNKYLTLFFTLFEKIDISFGRSLKQSPLG